MPWTSVRIIQSGNFWLLILLGPAIGGLITGILITLLTTDGVGPGVTSVIYAVQRQKGKISWKIGLRKWVASTATIGSGGSAGAEGPIVTIGAVVGSNIARVLGTGSQHTGTLLGCGAADVKLIDEDGGIIINSASELEEACDELEIAGEEVFEVVFEAATSVARKGPISPPPNPRFVRID